MSPSEYLNAGSHFFTVRLWHEDLGRGTLEWRGQVQHVLSGEAYWFRQLPELENYLKAMVRTYERARETEATESGED